MFRLLRYINGKYNPFNLNAILLDRRAGFEKLVPESFQNTDLRGYVKSSLQFIYWNIRHALNQTPPEYRFSWTQKYEYLYNETLLFNLPTVNNQKAFAKIIEKLKPLEGKIRMVTDFSYNNYPLFWIYFISLIYLPILWFKYWRCSVYDRRIVAYNLYDYIIAPGLTHFYFSICRRYKPECVLLSNDHRVFTKTLELVCEDCDIKTIYVQHASVSYAFPELHFSYSFLDGMDALQKYTDGDKCSKGKVFLLGAIRYDELSAYRISRKNYKRNCIGIAINLLDDNYIVNDVCNALLTIFPHVRLKVRSHPALKDTPFEFDNKNRIIYTCATDESMIDYLDSIDMQIASDSAVHFDSIIGGVKTIAYNFTKSEFGDNYGYVKRGMLFYAEDKKCLIQLMTSIDKINVNEKIVRFYDEAFRKSYAGTCSKMVSEFILNGYNVQYLKQEYGLVEQKIGKQSFFLIPDCE